MMHIYNTAHRAVGGQFLKPSARQSYYHFLWAIDTEGLSRCVHLKSNKVPSDSNVVISTIQRLFSLLTGKETSDDDDMTLTALMQTIRQKSDNISKAVSQLQELLKGIEE